MEHNRKMPFGKYKGTAISKIPIDYLKWVLTVCTNPDLWLEINDTIRQVEQCCLCYGMPDIGTCFSCGYVNNPLKTLKK